MSEMVDSPTTAFQNRTFHILTAVQLQRNTCNKIIKLNGLHLSCKIFNTSTQQRANVKYSDASQHRVCMCLCVCLRAWRTSTCLWSCAWCSHSAAASGETAYQVWPAWMAPQTAPGTWCRRTGQAPAPAHLPHEMQGDGGHVWDQKYLKKEKEKHIEDKGMKRSNPPFWNIQKRQADGM